MTLAAVPGSSAQPVVHLTQLTPQGPQYAGKCIDANGDIRQDRIKYWTWKLIPIHDLADLFDQIRYKQRRSLCLIRGAPHGTTPRVTRRMRAGDDYHHGFVDAPTAWLALDVDDAPLPPGEDWLRDPEGAVLSIVDRFGNAFRDAGFVWQFTAQHGLERGRDGRWTGGLTRGTVRVRLHYLLDCPISYGPTVSWLRMLKAFVPELDKSTGRVVQPIYTAAPLFEADNDPIPRRVGLIEGTEERLHVPHDLEVEGRWFRAEGRRSSSVLDHPDRGSEVDHPNLDAAITAIGTPVTGDGRGDIYPHLKSAARHLVQNNPRTEHVSVDAYVAALETTLRRLIERHRREIAENLRRHRRSKADLAREVDDDIGRYIRWLVEHPESQRKTVRRCSIRWRHPLHARARDIFDADQFSRASHEARSRPDRLRQVDQDAQAGGAGRTATDARRSRGDRGAAPQVGTGADRGAAR